MTSKADAVLGVQQTLCAYCRGIDRIDAQLLRQVFAPEATIDLGAIYRGGVGGFIETATRFMSSMRATRHELCNVLVRVDGAEARAESYVRAWHLVSDDKGDRELVVLGRYLNALRLHGDDWLIVRHTELIDWGAENETSTHWFAANEEMPKGRRDRRDLSYEFLSQ